MSETVQVVVSDAREANRSAGRRIRRFHDCFRACEDYRDRVEAHRLDSDRPIRSYAVIDPFILARDELSAALTLSCKRVTALLDYAIEMHTRCPAVLETMEAGHIDEYTAGIIIRRLRGISDNETCIPVAASICAELCAHLARGRRFSRAELTRLVDRRVRAACPESVKQLEDEAHRSRHVTFTPGDDGMTDLYALLPAAEAEILAERLNHDAAALADAAASADAADSANRTDAANAADADRAKDRTHAADEPHGTNLWKDASLSAFRADALSALALAPAPATEPSASEPSATEPDTTEPSASEPSATEPDTTEPSASDLSATSPTSASPTTDHSPVVLRPEVTVIAAGADHDGEVHFRRSGQGSLQMLTEMLDSSAGASFHTLGTDITDAEPNRARDYRVPAHLARRIRQRDGTCRHPGCSVPARACDIDHVRSFHHADPDSGGLTTESNLMCLCRSHHRHKTFGDFTYALAPDGELSITTLTGISAVTRPSGPLAHARDCDPSTPTESAPADTEPTPEATRLHRRRQRDIRQQAKLTEQRRRRREAERQRRDAQRRDELRRDAQRRERESGELEPGGHEPDADDPPF